MTKPSTALLALALCACLPADDTDDTNTDDTAATDDTSGSDVTEEPNDDRDSAYEVTLPAIIEAAIDPSTDVDWYTFDATEDVTVSITAVESTLELYIDVYDPTDNNIASWDTGDRGATFTDTITVSTTGKYYVKIESAYGNDTGTYTVEFD